MLIEGVYIAGTGHAIPPRVPVEEAIKQGRYRQEWRSGGLQSLAVAPPYMSPVDLAITAGREAVLRSGEDPQGIGPLFHATTFGIGVDLYPHASAIQRGIGAGPESLATLIHQGCEGALVGVLHACRALRIEPHRPAIVTAADVWEPVELIDRWSAMVGWAFGDGGAALVLSGKAGFARILSICSRSFPGLVGMSRGQDSLRLAPHRSKIDLRDRIRHFFDTEMDREKYAQLRNTTLRNAVDAALTDSRSALSDIRRIVVNFGDYPRVSDEFLKPLQITAGRTAFDFGRKVGHTGAADPLLGFDELVRSGELAPGDRFMLVGTGLGRSCVVLVGEMTRKAATVPAPRNGHVVTLPAGASPRD